MQPRFGPHAKSIDAFLDSVAYEVVAEITALNAQGTSKLILLHTDLVGTVGTVSISPGVEQTVYGLFSDLVDIARSL